MYHSTSSHYKDRPINLVRKQFENEAYSGYIFKSDWEDKWDRLDIRSKTLVFTQVNRIRW